ncbi:hypothetical protein IFM89_032158 [Coptis chinensis]|uniref:Transcription factor MYC/MYB N-terminal domain-containing protein n=1 Tax=Coptis chinensis TaxID=261450 RepID=A0A835IZL9_9MAGN|nr:hypothetical protein IFM89_032158 [Coptis chinensis]
MNGMSKIPIPYKKKGMGQANLVIFGSELTTSELKEITGGGFSRYTGATINPENWPGLIVRGSSPRVFKECACFKPPHHHLKLNTYGSIGNSSAGFEGAIRDHRVSLFSPNRWDIQGGAFDRSRGNRRNWYRYNYETFILQFSSLCIVTCNVPLYMILTYHIYYRILAWEDGFCNFTASTEVDSGECNGVSVYGNSEFQHLKGLQPELFFKMSHEIYNYGEGLIGKVAADHSQKWVYKEETEQAINFLSAWQNPGDSHPRTWEAQFQSGIKTIALVAVREGVIQLGSVHKVMEDPSFVVLLQKKFSYLESIPGVLLPHPSSSAFPYKVDGYTTMPTTWPFHPNVTPPTTEYYDQFGQPVRITPSMSSLEALLAKLPSVVPTSTSPSSSGYCESMPPHFLPSHRQLELNANVVDDTDGEYRQENEMGESSGSMSQYYNHQYHHFNLSSRSDKGF